MLLFSNQAADGDSPAYNWPGGPGTLVVQGSLGGGTVKLQISNDKGATWLDAKDELGAPISLNAVDMQHFAIAQSCRIRGNLAGATAPDVTAWANPGSGST